MWPGRHLGRAGDHLLRVRGNRGTDVTVEDRVSSVEKRVGRGGVAGGAVENSCARFVNRIAGDSRSARRHAGAGAVQMDSRLRAAGDYVASDGPAARSANVDAVEDQRPVERVVRDSCVVGSARRVTGYGDTELRIAHVIGEHARAGHVKDQDSYGRVARVRRSIRRPDFIDDRVGIDLSSGAEAKLNAIFGSAVGGTLSAHFVAGYR